MAITITEVEKLADLARIGLSEEEKKKLQKDAEEILAFVGAIQKVETDIKAEARVGTPYNVMREDNEPHESGAYTEVLLAQAPDTERGYVKVKKIL